MTSSFTHSFLPALHNDRTPMLKVGEHSDEVLLKSQTETCGKEPSITREYLSVGCSPDDAKTYGFDRRISITISGCFPDAADKVVELMDEFAKRIATL